MVDLMNPEPRDGATDETSVGPRMVDEIVKAEEHQPFSLNGAANVVGNTGDATEVVGEGDADQGRNNEHVTPVDVGFFAHSSQSSTNTAPNIR
jgi:hypothetical protein